MSEVAQDIVDVAVTDAPVQNQADTDTPVEEVKVETEETDEQSPDVESQEPEITPEEKIETLEKEVASKQKAIDRKTAAFHDMQRAHDRKMQELKALEAKVQTDAPQEPKIDDFDTFEEFDKARVNFINEQAKQSVQKEFLEQQKQVQAQQQMQARMDLRATQEAEYIQSNPNYRASVAELDGFFKTAQISDGVGEAVLDVVYEGNVPQIIDYFGRNNGENLDKLAQIARMSPVKAAIEVYKIQQSLTAPASKERKQPPKPLNKPKGGGKPKTDLHKGDVLKNLGLK